jgi:hypothetical protein
MPIATQTDASLRLAIASPRAPAASCFVGEHTDASAARPVTRGELGAEKTVSKISWTLENESSIGARSRGARTACAAAVARAVEQYC